MKNLFNRFVREEAGQDLTEYAMLVAFIAFVVLVGVTLFGTRLQAWWNSVGGAVGAWAPA
jgi:pilus assembly protein Flp/PilA